MNNNVTDARVGITQKETAKQVFAKLIIIR